MCCAIGKVSKEVVDWGDQLGRTQAQFLGALHVRRHSQNPQITFPKDDGLLFVES